MASYNKVILAGNLTRDPELRTLPKGTSVIQFSLAINRKYTGTDGSAKEEVTYVDIDAFGKHAETIAKYCKKGSGLLVEGRLRLDQWEDKQTGEKRRRLGVVLESFTFLGGRNSTNGDDYEDVSPARRPSSNSESRNNPPISEPEGIDEDVPF